MNDASWIFVIGAPRSGTSLLRRLLSCHRRLWINPELRVFDLLKLAGALDQSPHPDQPATLTQRGQALGRRFTELLARHQLRELGKARFGDKYPPYSAQVSHLARLYPNAQFLHIVRDGRDVVASMARTHTANRGWRRAPDVAPIPQLAQTWSTFVRAARKSGQALGQARYLEVRYENLLSDPIPVLGKALRFFGEALDEGVLRGAAEVRPGKTWRETLVPAELVAFCTVHPAEMLLHHLGYPPTPTPAHRSLEIQVGARPAPSAPLQARIDRGESSPQLWFEAGEAALQARDQKRAVSHFVRAIRGQAIDRRAVLRLLEMPDAPESVFAAMNAERMMAPDMRAALTRWASGRGLDEAASRALFAPKSETEAA